MSGTARRQLTSSGDSRRSRATLNPTHNAGRPTRRARSDELLVDRIRTVERMIPPVEEIPAERAEARVALVEQVRHASEDLEALRVARLPFSSLSFSLSPSLCSAVACTDRAAICCREASLRQPCQHGGATYASVAASRIVCVLHARMRRPHRHGCHATCHVWQHCARDGVPECNTFVDTAARHVQHSTARDTPVRRAAQASRRDGMRLA